MIRFSRTCQSIKFPECLFFQFTTENFVTEEKAKEVEVSKRAYVVVGGACIIADGDFVIVVGACIVIEDRSSILRPHLN